jgi:ribosomal protein L37E
MTSTIEIGEAVRVSMPGGLFLHGDIQEVNADSVKVKGRWFSVADVKTEEEIEHTKKSNIDAGRRIRQAEAGTREVVGTPAPYTSQECPACGHKEKKPLSQRKHVCSECGYTAHRDTAAAQVILSRAGQARRALRQGVLAHA